ncbi:unnamed protein product [Bursaphelenchus okinawaensis]|uniref:Uncharacterized protein n=1 Tax=Bursaphelenchus okinawaensis TaxID=465554 RepID=A0A811K1W4_9BILA|nr:unnamed protein product [Bursaphelenchus okinawaensis]CAG9089408.1 unnamed protein product [Bursaphelenchus okinawaensis]
MFSKAFVLLFAATVVVAEGGEHDAGTFRKIYKRIKEEQGHSETDLQAYILYQKMRNEAVQTSADDEESFAIVEKFLNYIEKEYFAIPADKKLGQEYKFFTNELANLELLLKGDLKAKTPALDKFAVAVLPLKK